MFTSFLIAAALAAPPVDSATMHRVGRLRSSNGLGTAFLVGPCVAMTARHVFREPSVGARATLELPLSGDKTGVTVMSTGTGQAKDQGSYHPGDWAVVKLDACLGEKLGYIPTTTWDVSMADSWRSNGRGLVVLGFPGGWKAANGPRISRDCQVYNFGAGALSTTCNLWHGDSGAPVMMWRDVAGKPTLVAIAIVSTVSGDSRRSQSVPISDKLPNATLSTTQSLASKLH